MRISLLAVIVTIFVLFAQWGVSETTHFEPLPEIDALRVLDLETAQRLAIKNNPSLQAAMDRVVQAAERIIQATSADYPKLDVNASAANLWRSERQNQMLMNPDDSQSVFSSDITATYVLFDGFARKFRKLSASYGHRETEEVRRDAARLLLWSVASAYFNAQLERENIAIARANEAFNIRLTEDAKARYEAGMGSLSDILNFDVQVNSARTRVLQAEQFYNTAMHGLAALMGISTAAFPPSLELAALETEKPSEFNLPETDERIRYAVEHRPDMARYDAILKQTDAGIDLARARLYPTLNLAGAIEGERTDDAAFDGDDFGATIALTINYNLFEGGNTASKIREARVKKSEVENSMEQARITVVSEVLNAIETLKFAQDQVKLQRSNQELVQQNRDLVEKEYSAGVASLVRLNEAQRDLTQAQSLMAQALFSLRRAWQQLDAVTGSIDRSRWWQTEN